MYSQVRIVIPRFEDFEDPSPPPSGNRAYPSPLLLIRLLRVTMRDAIVAVYGIIGGVMSG